MSIYQLYFQFLIVFLLTYFKLNMNSNLVNLTLISNLKNIFLSAKSIAFEEN